MEKLFEAQQGTILREVNEIWLKGEFICPIDEPVATNEKVLCEFTPYQKALYLTWHNLMQKNIEGVAGQQLDAVNFDELAANQKKSNTMFYLLWLGIREELTKEGKRPKELGLRANWQLVEVKKTESHPSGDVDSLLAMLRELQAQRFD